jgi:hypothetical protein
MRKNPRISTVAAEPQTNNLVVTPQPLKLALKDISDLLENLSLQACVELTGRLLTSFSSFHSGAARPRAVLKTALLFVAEYDSTDYGSG